MGCLSQDSAALQNFDKFILSAWVRIPSETYGLFSQIPILEFGKSNNGSSVFNEGTDYVSSIISIGGSGLLVDLASLPFTPPITSVPNSLVKNPCWVREQQITVRNLPNEAHPISDPGYEFTGDATLYTVPPLSWADVAAIVTGKLGDGWALEADLGNGTFVFGRDAWVCSGSPTDPSRTWTAPGGGTVHAPDYVQFLISNTTFASPAGNFIADAWHHILVSADCSKVVEVDTVAQVGNTAAIQVIQPAFLWVAVDDVDYSQNVVKIQYPFGPLASFTVDKGGILPRTFIPGTYVNSGKKDISWFKTPGSAGSPIPVCWVTVLPGTDDPPTPATALPMKVKINGDPIGIPAPPWDVSNIGKVEMAEVQIFLGQAIDTSDVSMRRLFIDGDRKPVDPAIAAAALGPPAYAFRRNKKKKIKFEVNRGTGGGFELLSAATDYTPGPGQ